MKLNNSPAKITLIGSIICLTPFNVLASSKDAGAVISKVATTPYYATVDPKMNLTSVFDPKPKKDKNEETEIETGYQRK